MKQEFRAWNLQQKKYMNDVVAIRQDRQGIEVGTQNKKSVAGDIIWWPSDEIVVEFYTGLKDRNGDHIYEGDIVQEDDYSNGAYFGVDQPRRNVEIVYEENYQGIGFHLLHVKTSELIGNIHENHDLL